ncbi:MAG: ABC transporter substrate-binding protein, partial [Euryarchaeota archaeon]|nr:ABC transporter substrate-binding protein [Euryarchaeota archaeon]
MGVDIIKKAILVLLFVLLSAVMIGCIAEEKTAANQTTGENITKTYDGKKILYIDSYHEGYEWSDGITKGVESALDGTRIELKIHRMDTKRNDTAEFGKLAALKAKSVIEDFKPDVVIVSDDPAFKYLLMPYYRDASLPFVFCAINWDASIYGAPYNNTAGMIEVSMTPRLIDFLKEYSKGDRVGFMAGNTTTDWKNAEYYKKLFNISFTS